MWHKAAVWRYGPSPCASQLTNSSSPTKCLQNLCSIMFTVNVWSSMRTFALCFFSFFGFFWGGGGGCFWGAILWLNPAMVIDGDKGNSQVMVCWEPVPFISPVNGDGWSISDEIMNWIHTPRYNHTRHVFILWDFSFGIQLYLKLWVCESTTTGMRD